ncbi:MAG: hypothetical protein CMO06_18925 [Thalassospira sp.]|uniref:flagellin N-terminal helical domain-containing protein n=1 Tax=Thalassospira sp. TaxID=1912094 RepID=UPI000C3A0389|nr:hypothetical protein [Thalassospira sp.]MAZ35215.1 hypothetical protein [Thalassospira sp.]
MQAVGSPYPVYTDTARAIAPQNRLLASVDSIQSSTSQNTSRSNDALRHSSSVSQDLRGSLGRADDLLDVAANDLSRIGSVLDEIDTLVTSVENNSSLSRTERAFISSQIQDYLEQIDDIAASSNYDGQDLLISDRTIELQIGSGTTSSDRLNVELFASGTEGLATGFSAIDVSDDAAVSNARDLVDAAQEALSSRELSLQADRQSIAGAADRSRVSQVAGDNILQAQLAAAEPNITDQARSGIIETFQGYLGEVSARLQDQTVTVGGISLPEPVTERDDPFAYDPNADPFDRDDTEYFEPDARTNTSNPPLSTGFGGYDSNGGGTGIGGASSGGGAGGASGTSGSRVSIEV